LDAVLEVKLGEDPGNVVGDGVRAEREVSRDVVVALAASVPVAFTTFPGEVWAAPRSWVEVVYPDLAYFNEVDRGGHFAAWEEPELFSTEVRAAFSSMRG
jgi:hypothetical protein